MNEQVKKNLYQALCALLPYNTTVEIDGKSVCELTPFVLDTISVLRIRPVLKSLRDITPEDKITACTLSSTSYTAPNWRGATNRCYGIQLFEEEDKKPLSPNEPTKATPSVWGMEALTFLISQHYDVWGLIDGDLAIESKDVKYVKLN